MPISPPFVPGAGDATTPPRAPGLDHAAVSAWLEAALPELEPPVRLTSIGHGRSNLTYRIDDASGAAWVLRRPPLGPLLASAHDMEREHRILECLARAGAAVPRPRAICTDPEVTGAAFFVMDLVEGLVLDQVLVASSLSEDARRASGHSLMRTLADLHAIDVDAAGLGDLGRRSAYAGRQLRRWRGQWRSSGTADDVRIERVAARLEASIPEQRETTLVHGDYRLDNVIVDERGAVHAVLDWELSTLGDPLADLGMLVAYTPTAPSEVLPIQEGVELLPGFSTVDQLVETYAAASGRSLEALGFWVALAYWKIAIILQGVHHRWLNDPANGGEAAGQLASTVSWLARRAEEGAWTTGR